MEHTDKNPYKSDYLRKAYVEIRAELRDELRDELESRFRDESVLTVLEARDLVVTPTQRERILSCRDHATLDHWLRRAVAVTDVAALFDEPG